MGFGKLKAFASKKATQVKGFAAEKAKEAKADVARRRSESKELREVERKALFQARKKEAASFAKTKAQHERRRRVSGLSQGSSFGGLSSFLTGETPGTKLVPKTRRKRRKKRTTTTGKKRTTTTRKKRTTKRKKRR